jgi:hypothetical protein
VQGSQVILPRIPLDLIHLLVDSQQSRPSALSRYPSLRTYNMHALECSYLRKSVWTVDWYSYSPSREAVPEPTSKRTTRNTTRNHLHTGHSPLHYLCLFPFATAALISSSSSTLTGSVVCAHPSTGRCESIPTPKIIRTSRTRNHSESASTFVAARRERSPFWPIHNVAERH